MRLRYVIYLITFTAVFVFYSCKDEPPVIPGLSHSTILMITKPDSATVYLNNQMWKNTTPLPLSDIEPGFYKIDLSRKNYLDTSLYHFIDRGVTDTITIQLREDPKFWWKYYSKSNSALPTELVGKIKIDASGNKWIATRGAGLVKFDGTSFTVFNTSNSGIADNYINDILLLQGQIWIATNKGFCRFDGSVWKVFNKAVFGFSDEQITSIVMDKTNVIWAATNSAGIIRFDGVSFKEYNTRNSQLISNEIRTLFVDLNNKLWIGTVLNGICTYDGISWKSYSTYNSTLPSNNLKVISCDKNGNIWAGTEKSLSLFQNNSWVNYSVNNASDISFDSQNRIWCASNSGLLSYDHKSWVSYNTYNSGLKSNSLVSVFVDSDDNKWITAGGIYSYSGAK